MAGGGVSDESRPEDVARWMLQEIGREGFLSHHEAVPAIERRFGERFSYRSTRGSRVIVSEVLRAFLKASGDSVVWSRRGKFWRPRQPSDRPGREQP